MKTAASIEPLELRIAPASVFTYTDVDGDIVKVISSLGDLNAPGVVTKVIAGAIGGEQLTLLDLRDVSFQGTNISTTVTKVAGGDGLVNIGRIDATGRDLGTVTIKGDLAVLDAGDPAAAASACKALMVESMGRFGFSTGALDLVSNIDGKLDKLTVKFSVKEARIDVTDSAATNGKIGAVTIGGSLLGGLGNGSGSIAARDGLGLIAIKGDVLGSGGTGSGAISSAKTVAGVTIGGSLVGGAGAMSGAIRSGTDMGPIKIAQNLESSSGNDSGKIDSQGKLTSLTVGGSVIGGVGRQDVNFGSAGQIHASGRIGSITIRGSLIGGHDPTPADMVFEASYSGSIGAFDDLGSLKIGGSVIGGLARNSCRIFISGALGSVTIGGSFLGDDASDSAHLSAQKLGAVRIGGDIVGAPDQFDSGQIAVSTTFASLTVGGSMRGTISAGDLGPVKIGGDLDGRAGGGVGFIDTFSGSIASVTVGGSLIGASASDGSVNFSGAIRSMADIGPIRIGGDMLGGSITGDALLNQSGSIRAGGRIASVFVGGSIISGSDASTSVMIDCASIRAGDDIGAIVVKGSVLGNLGNGNAGNESFIIISARGQDALAPGAKTDLAIKSLSIGGGVSLTKVLAGFAPFHDDDEGSNGNASIGAITIGGDLFASSIVAGVRDAQGDGFGDNDDILIPTPAADAIVARIASVVIKGAVIGAPNPFFQCGFEAQQIGSFKVGAYTAPLTAATDAPIVLTPLTANQTIREIP